MKNNSNKNIESEIKAFAAFVFLDQNKKLLKEKLQYD